MFLFIRWDICYITHWGRVTHICVNELTIIGSDNGLSPGRRQAIIWTNTGILLIGPLRTNFSEIIIEIYSFSFKKMHLKMLSGKWRPSCLSLNVLIKMFWVFWHHSDVTWVSWHHSTFFSIACSCTKETLKLRITGPVKGMHQWLVDSPHKGPVMWKGLS